MKKVMITLGFAAVTIMAANAQEVPAAEEQPQNTVQTQPAPQDETLDSDTQPMDDRAVNDTYNDQTTEPETQTVRDEINEMPTEPMQDESLEDNSSVEEPIDEMQEEVIEMQGENPDAQPSMQDTPDGEADDQSYSSVQDQDNSSAMNEDSDQEVMTISESELPEAVSQAFQDSEYANATIEKVYMLDKPAVDKLMQNNAEQMYIGDQNPDKIYQLQVKSDDAQNILYYNENGDLIGSTSI